MLVLPLEITNRRIIMAELATFIISFAVGWVIGLILLAFFQPEIFKAMDWITNKVRGWFGLEP